ncbi:Chromatin assembly factor 1 subunit A-B [Thelohanellus kitauei]|uniref:Chromatin assembly factor 1 subunit A-B n=1 Tax=Thelohanellus kitauei TaxID=669202 RepID=A0A0C2I5X3_THEKT|nr:Chromatin assembly factor 1 subunit A-B [Thelohanellus kitauei]
MDNENSSPESQLPRVKTGVTAKCAKTPDKGGKRLAHTCDDSQKENKIHNFTSLESTPVKQPKLSSFFGKIGGKGSDTQSPPKQLYGVRVGNFLPIQLKPGMTFFKRVPKPMDPNFDSKIIVQDSSILKIDIDLWKKLKMKSGIRSLHSTLNNYYAAKFFKFAENYRPPYYGTWSKKSVVVSGRRPFSRDPLLNYEVDSDLEWEEEEPGEDLGTESDPEDAVDSSGTEDDFIVPHGYLSEGEGIEDSNESFKTKKTKFEKSQSNTRFKKLKPVIVCSQCDLINKIDNESLLKLSAKIIEYPENTMEGVVDLCFTSPKVGKAFPEELIPELIHFCHNNTSLKKIVVEFRNFLETKYPEKSKITSKQIETKIREISEFKSKKYTVLNEHLMSHAPDLLDKPDPS